jgi:hypothetical protein
MTEKGRSQDILVTVGYGVIGIAAANWLDYGMFKASGLPFTQSLMRYTEKV